MGGEPGVTVSASVRLMEWCRAQDSVTWPAPVKDALKTHTNTSSVFLNACLYITFGWRILITDAVYGSLGMQELMQKALDHQALLAKSYSQISLQCIDMASSVGRIAFDATIDRWRLDDSHLKVGESAQERYRSNGPLMATRRECIVADDGRHVIFIPNSLVVLGKAVDSVAWGRMVWASPDVGGFLDGYVLIGQQTGVNIFDLARTLRMGTEPTELVDGTECFRLSGDGNDWRIRLWIAPSKDFSIAKAHIEGTNKAEGQNYDINIDRVQFAQFDGISFVSEARYIGRISATNSMTPDVYEFIAKRSKLVLNPHFDKSTFSLKDIPNGTPVQLEGQIPSGVRYVWKDGCAVAAVDSQMVQDVGNAASEYASQRVSAPRGDANPDRLNAEDPWTTREALGYALLGVLTLCVMAAALVLRMRTSRGKRGLV